VLLAGRAAEEVVFGEISTGAGNDLERATDIARRRVAELGMSSRIGPVNLMRRQNAFLQPGDDGRGEYSEATAQIIDAEVQRLLVEGYNRALDILRTDRNVLECLANLLLQKEVVERTELRELMGTSSGATRDGSGSGNGTRPEVGHAPAGTAD
jgi:cell division protease FtsH